MSREWVKSLGLTGRDARRLERALCALADCEGAVVRAMCLMGAPQGNSQHALADVCAALRKIADAWEDDA